MAKERSESVSRSREDREEEDEMEVKNVNSSKKEIEKKCKRKSRKGSGSESEPDERRRPSRSKRESKSKSRRHSSSESASESYSSSEGSYLESESESEESEEERRRRKRKERKRREREERERRRRKDKEKKRRKKEDKERKKKKKKKDKGSKGAVTESWGKYGIIKETDMWNKRPEFTAWLAEVKQVNLESLPNWEEKLMFKDFMEDHNTATFPSKKYYNLDAYHTRKMEKQMKRGLKKVIASERTVFDDEEQRRQELLCEREKQKAEEVENLKRQMRSGMAQAMKEQAQLREEMAYQYKLGNFEAAAAIQKRLEPDVPT